MTKPLCIDLFCGLGGWTEGFLAEGWDVVGFDIEQHVYGEERYPAQLVLQDVRTIHGKQLKDAAMIVASSPCQAYSYMAMPWSKAKAIAAALRGKGEFPEGYNGYRTIEELNELFEHPKRIQREAIEAAGGRFIPMIQENVRGAIPWVGRSQWHFGSFHLWGDVPALMPVTFKATKVPGFRFDGRGGSFQTASVEGTKNEGGSWFNVGSPGQKIVGQNPVRQLSAGWRSKHYEQTDKAALQDGTKVGGDWFSDPESPSRTSGSKSKARKAASAKIAKIPFALASHIARVYYPKTAERVA